MGGPCAGRCPAPPHSSASQRRSGPWPNFDFCSIDFDDNGREYIASLGNSLDRRRQVIAERLADFFDALNERVVGYDDVRPDVVDQLILRDEPPTISNEIEEDIERLRPQWHLDLIASQASRPGIDGKPVEAIGLGR